MKATFHALVLVAATAFGQQSAAVSLSNSGLGSVVLFPYYTAQGSNDTLITLVNTTLAGKAVKLRFHEGRNGRTVLDLNLYLGAADAWAAAVTRDTAGNPMLRVFDTSCTVPALAPSPTVPGAREIAFSNVAYDNYDRAGSGLDRAREGYVEAIEMGEINPSFMLPSGSTSISFLDAVSRSSSTVIVPAACDAVATGWSAGGTFLTSGGAELTPPAGGLMGSGTLLNVPEGTDYSYEPVVLASVLSNEIHTAPGAAHPNLNDAFPSSLVVVGDADTHSTWANGADAVSAVLMHRAVIDEYFTSPELAAATDLVFTFPTKPFYVALESDTGTGTQPPFTARFDDREPVGPGATGPLLTDGLSTGACEPISILRMGREQEQNSPPPIDLIPPNADPGALCWTASVITMGNLLGSGDAVSIDSHPYSPDGWMRLSFADSDNKLTSNEGQQYLGLPVIGFSVQKYVNGNVGGVLSNYGGAFTHKYETLIQ